MIYLFDKCDNYLLFTLA